MQMEHESFDHTELKPEVMIVDDQEMNREILAALIDEEFTPVMCKDGIEAIETLRARKRTISLVLLDLHMPGMSGQDVLRTLKADPELGKIPVIVMTGESDAEIESLELGASDFIPKPYPNAGVVLARMRRLIELFEARRPDLALHARVLLPLCGALRSAPSRSEHGRHPRRREPLPHDQRALRQRLRR